jgi:hypothetical protein
MENNNTQPVKENHIDNARALSIRDLLKYVPEDEVRSNLAKHFDDSAYIDKLVAKAKKLSSDSERKTAFNAFEGSPEDRQAYWKQVDRDHRETQHTDYGRDDDYKHDARAEADYVPPSKKSKQSSGKFDWDAFVKSAERHKQTNEEQVDEEASILPYALTLFPMLSDKDQSLKYLRMLQKKFDNDFAKSVLTKATEFKKGQANGKMREDGAVQQSTVAKVDAATNSVTLNNKDGTKTVAPTAMLMKDPATGKLMLNKPKVTPGAAPAISTTSLKPLISTGMSIDVKDDVNRMRKLSGL